MAAATRWRSRDLEGAMAGRWTWVPVVAAVALGVAACGGNTSAAGHDAAPTDGGTDQLIGDALPDGAPEDGAADGGRDGPPGDGGLTTPPQFVGETAGGGRRTSAHYRLDVFVAPVRPVGERSSTSYQLKLGPGAAANAR
jgi:hypothetical protein